jgi:putative transposase
MARANRHHIPNYVWHITHRCHKQEFLLKFSKDRQRWIHWLYEAKKRFGLCVLNYTVTSNHIHLLVFDNGQDVIPKSMQLIAGRTAQEYNQRKKRKGAFWEDRYHATAIETNEHLFRCIAYIDLNMVRAGVIKHPSEWPFSAYNEIQNPPKRYSLIAKKTLMDLCGIKNIEELKHCHKSWTEEMLCSYNGSRDPKWTESIAVGNKNFLEQTKEKLGDKAKGRNIVTHDENYSLKEAHSSYNAVFDTKKDLLRAENTYFWNNY